MANELCHVKNGNDLAHSKSDNALIYKAARSEVTVRVPWTPQSYVCETYDCYHVITFTCTGAFTSGSGTIVSKVDGGSETIFTLLVTGGPAVFTVSTSITTGCSAVAEDPGVTCRVLAAQSGAAPVVKANVSAPRTASGASATTTAVSFDANCKLTGVA